jgi:hypothetical protein
MMYRNKKLRESAKHEACVSCGLDDGTIVWAHSNSLTHDKGTGIKAHDLFGAYLCHRCHADYDQKRLTVDDKEWFKIMWEKSMLVACRKGYL